MTKNVKFCSFFLLILTDDSDSRAATLRNCIGGKKDMKGRELNSLIGQFNKIKVKLKTQQICICYLDSSFPYAVI